MIFVLRVVTMLHVAAGELAESEGNLHFIAAIIQVSYTINVFPSPTLPYRGRKSVFGKNLSFFEVNVDRVAPTVATIFDRPNLQITHARSGGKTTGVHRKS